MASIYTLLSTLTNNNPTKAYVHLLDLTGEYRALPPPPTLQALTIELYLHGRREEARVLEEVAGSDVGTHPALQVVLHCARLRKKEKVGHALFVEADGGEEGREEMGVFREADIEQGVIVENGIKDWIVERARFELGEGEERENETKKRVKKVYRMEELREEGDREKELALCVVARLLVGGDGRMGIGEGKHVVLNNEVDDILCRACRHGQVYSRMQEALQNSELPQALREFVAHRAYIYKRDLLHSVEEGGINSAWRTLDVAETYLGEWMKIERVIRKVEGKKGAAVVDALMEMGEDGDVIEACMREYVRQVLRWTLLGVGGGIFGDEEGVESMPQIWRSGVKRAGWSRRLLKRIKPMGTEMLQVDREIMEQVEEADVMTIVRVVNEWVEKVKRGGVNGQEIHLGVEDCIESEKGEQCCDPSVQEEVQSPIAVQKWAMQGLWNAAVPTVCFAEPELEEEGKNGERELNIRLFSEDAYDTFEREDKEERMRRELRPPFKVLYGQILVDALQKVDQLVQQELLRHFERVLDIHLHLRNLRSYALLGAGDFADVLIEQIEAAVLVSDASERYIQLRANAALTFYGTAGPGVRSIRDRMHLNRCLETALNLTALESNSYVTCLGLDAIQGDEGKSLWDCSMEVKYDVEYPLSMFVEEGVMEMYSRLFDFFLRILRARKSLRKLFLLSRRNSALRSRAYQRTLQHGELRVKLWLFCWYAESFVTIFGGFEMEQVLGASWQKFEDNWRGMESIWDLKEAHAEFLQGCIRRCLLSEKHKSVLGVMTGGFDIVVKVHQQVAELFREGEHGIPRASNDVLDLLVSSLASLKRRVAFLTDVLERLLSGGGYVHLEDLLARLKFAQQNER